MTNDTNQVRPLSTDFSISFNSSHSFANPILQNKFNFLQIQPLTVEFTTPATRIFELIYFHGVRLNLKIIAVRFSKSMFLDYLGHGLSVGELSLPLKY